MGEQAPPKFAKGDRVRIVHKLFPSFDEGLFNRLPKVGTVLHVDPGSILPYNVAIDRFEHHPFWFAENQLTFEDASKEEAWQAAQKAKAPSKPGAA